MGGIEETKLLCGEIELGSVGVHESHPRFLADKYGSLGEEREVVTSYGPLTVSVQGELSRPAILTYHDIGLNSVSNFGGFINFYETRILMEHFCVVHVNAPGQQHNAAKLDDSFQFPSCDQLAEQVCELIGKLALKRVVAVGVGAGGNVLARAALAKPALFDGLCLVNSCCTAAGWVEWGQWKVHCQMLRAGGAITQRVVDYLLWHHFGNVSEAPHDLVELYTSQFHSAKPHNLASFIETYNQRTDLSLVRPTNDFYKQSAESLRVPVLLVCGGRSPHKEATVTFNSRLDPATSQWIELKECSIPLDEKIDKLSEAFRLFLQGQGFVPGIARKMSTASVYK